jgi:hypothetical protein
MSEIVVKEILGATTLSVPAAEWNPITAVEDMCKLLHKSTGPAGVLFAHCPLKLFVPKNGKREDLKSAHVSSNQPGLIR